MKINKKTQYEYMKKNGFRFRRRKGISSIWVKMCITKDCSNLAKRNNKCIGCGGTIECSISGCRKNSKYPGKLCYYHSENLKKLKKKENLENSKDSINKFSEKNFIKPKTSITKNNDNIANITNIINITNISQNETSNKDNSIKIQHMINLQNEFNSTVKKITQEFEETKSLMTYQLNFLSEMIYNLSNKKCEGDICMFYPDILRPFGKYNSKCSKYLCNYCDY
jgi:hypothetical protein